MGIFFPPGGGGGGSSYSYSTKSIVIVSGGNGHSQVGNTSKRRWTTTNRNEGTDITYSDGATNGALFLLNSDGLYGMMLVDSASSTVEIGISKNSSASQGPSSQTFYTTLLTASRVDPHSSGNTGHPIFVFDFFPATTEIRVHTTGTDGTANWVSHFYIARFL